MTCVVDDVWRRRTVRTAGKTRRDANGWYSVHTVTSDEGELSWEVVYTLVT